MIRVKRSKTTHNKHKKILQLAKGYYGARSRSYRSAKQAVIKAQQYAYRDRKKKKINMRKLWIIQINAKVRNYGITYNQFVYKLRQKKININKKILISLIQENCPSFDKIIKLINK